MAEFPVGSTNIKTVPVWEAKGIWKWGGGFKSVLDLFPGQFMQDIVKGHQALVTYTCSTFFAWNRGYKLLFWRWSIETRTLAQHGHPLMCVELYQP